MSLRWRKDGRLLCGAKSEPEEGDCYIDDKLHYHLSVKCGAVKSRDDEGSTGLWDFVKLESGRAEAVKPYQIAAKAIDDMVRSVEARCLAADGPVTPTLQEITEHELRVIWVAADQIIQARALLQPKKEGE